MKAKIFEIVLHKLPSGKSPATALEERLNEFLSQHSDLRLVTTHIERPGRGRRSRTPCHGRRNHPSSFSAPCSIPTSRRATCSRTPPITPGRRSLVLSDTKMLPTYNKSEVPVDNLQCSMNFRDTQLQKHYDQTSARLERSRGTCARCAPCIATHDVFQMFEGPHSARVHETIEHLLCGADAPRIAPVVSAPGARTDFATLEFRDQFSRLTGERLEIADEISPKPS